MGRLLTGRMMGRAAALGALASALALGSAQAQNAYPTKPVKIISDSAAGSSNDVTARVLAEQFQKMWGQQVVILNHPGAGGGISARVAAQADNDGYTLYLPAASAFLALKGAPGVANNLPIELPRDFAPIGFFIAQPMFMGVSAKLGVKTVPELIALAKSKPGEIAYAATGRGRITHLTMVLFEKRAGVKLNFVPYTGGPAAAMNDVISGRIGIVTEGYSGIGGALDGVNVIGLAVASAQRVTTFPNLPTVAETLPDFEAGGWNVLVAPLGAPADILRKVSEDLGKVNEMPDVRERLAKIGAFPRKMSPDEVTAYVRRSQETWRPILEEVAKSGKK